MIERSPTSVLPRRRARRPVNGYSILIGAVLAIGAVVVAYPFYNTLVLSFATRKEYLQNASILFPNPLTLDSYKVLFASNNFLRGFLNSGIIVALGTAYSMLLSVMTAYALSRKNYPGRKLFGVLIVFTMYFSGGLVPYYILVSRIGLVDSLAALIVPPGINTFYMLILKAYLENVPSSLIESVKIDGGNDFTVLFRVAVPVSMPIMVTFILFYAVDRWNDWFGAVLFVKSPSKFPLQVILRTVLATLDTILKGTDFASQLVRTQKLFDDGVKMACIIVVTAPVLLLYPFAQKYFVKGIMVGSIKA